MNPFDDPVLKMLEKPIKRAIEPMINEVKGKIYAALIDVPPTSFYDELGDLYDLPKAEMDAIWLIACRAAASKCQ